jgi:hypothetical protein
MAEQEKSGSALLRDRAESRTDPLHTTGHGRLDRHHERQCPGTDSDHGLILGDTSAIL